MRTNRRTYEMQKQLLWDAKKAVSAALDAIETAHAVNREEKLEPGFSSLREQLLGLDTPMRDFLKELHTTAPQKLGKPQEERL